MEERIRVMIADDQRPTRRGLRALLTLYPAVELVGEAADGQEAVRMVRECWPDVVLMDMQMPVLDGVNATRWIKLQWPGVKIVGLTVHAIYEDEAVAAGVDAFLIKGCAAETLIDAILQFRHFSSSEVQPAVKVKQIE